MAVLWDPPAQGIGGVVPLRRQPLRGRSGEYRLDTTRVLPRHRPATGRSHHLIVANPDDAIIVIESDAQQTMTGGWLRLEHRIPDD